MSAARSEARANNAARPSGERWRPKMRPSCRRSRPGGLRRFRFRCTRPHHVGVGRRRSRIPRSLVAIVTQTQISLPARTRSEKIEIGSRQACVFSFGPARSAATSVRSQRGRRGRTLVARGVQYDVLGKRGVILEGPKRRPDPIRVRVCRQGEEQPPYDLIFVCLKSQQIGESAEHVAALLARDGSLVFPQNGIPWWYFEKLDSPLRGTRLPSLDPDGRIARAFRLDSVVGAVIYLPTDHPEPGRIVLADQPTDRSSSASSTASCAPDSRTIKALLEPAGLPSSRPTGSATYKWQKLLSNGVFIYALHGSLSPPRSRS